MSNGRELSQLAPLVTVDANNKITFASTSEMEMGGLTYPSTDGSNGQVLTTDGAGNLSFTTATGGGGGSTVGTYNFNITATTSDFDTAADTYEKVQVYVNGAFLDDDDFTFTANTGVVSLSEAVNSGEVVSIWAYSSAAVTYTNSDVDTHLNTGTAASGEVLTWNGSDYDWSTAGGGTFETLTCSLNYGYNVVDSNNTYSFTNGTYGPGSNFFVGFNAGINTDGTFGNGSHNNFIGYRAGQYNTTGRFNNFFGNFAGFNNTTGQNNNFFGNNAGCNNTTGSYNTFFGQFTGESNTSGNNNNFFGRQSGRCNTDGRYNNFFGFKAGYSNTTACHNNFFGNYAGRYNTTGCHNIAMGCRAGFNNTTGIHNNFFGRAAGYLNTTGSNNNFIGICAGFYNTTGSCNTYLGGFNGTGFATCSNHIFISDGAGNRRIEFNASGSLGVAGANFGTAGQVLTSCGNAAAPVWADAAGGGGGVFECVDTLSFYGHNIVDSHNTYSFTNGNYGSGSNFFVGQCAGINTNGGAGGGEGSYNAFFGRRAGVCNTTGSCNNFFGTNAGYFNTTGANNNYLGRGAGKCGTTSSNNNFIGYYAGHCNTTGNNNNFIGFCVGYNNTTGFSNNFIGYQAGHHNGNGKHNNYFGYRTGSTCYCVTNSTGSYNNFLGCGAGGYVTSGSDNNFLGRGTGYFNSSGSNNNFFGRNAGCCNTTGTNNNFIGLCAGRSNTTGSFNNFLGDSAGENHTTGCFNNFFGRLAGWVNSTGSYNNFFGLSAGRCNTTGNNNIAFGCNAYGGSNGLQTTNNSNRIIMGNTSHNCALIQIGWTTVSDCRDKIIHCNVQHGRGFLQNINPIEFSFKDRETGEAKEDKHRYGFSAQNVLEAEGENPVIVSTEDPDNLKLTSDYFIPVLVNAIKELSEEVDNLKAQVAELQNK